VVEPVERQRGGDGRVGHTQGVLPAGGVGVQDPALPGDVGRVGPRLQGEGTGEPGLVELAGGQGEPLGQAVEGVRPPRGAAVPAAAPARHPAGGDAGLRAGGGGGVGGDDQGALVQPRARPVGGGAGVVVDDGAHLGACRRRDGRGRGQRQRPVTGGGVGAEVVYGRAQRHGGAGRQLDGQRAGQRHGAALCRGHGGQQVPGRRGAGQDGGEL